jgi:hypothetical protein
LPKANIDSAKILVYANVSFNGVGWPWTVSPQLSLRKVTSDWNEMTITWSTQPSSNPTVVSSNTVTTVGGGSWGNPYTEFEGWLAFDITSLYKGRADGSIPNDGVMFRIDTPYCANGDEFHIWSSDYQNASLRPKLVVTTSPPVATSKDQCKDAGWRSFFRADGSSFRNQGDCIQYVNTGK